MKEVVEKKKPSFSMNIIDRGIAFFDPVRAARRLKARAFMVIVGGFVGASKSRRSLKEWNTTTHDADADILPDLATLRDRSRDMIRNNPIAAGAIKTKVTNVIGTGLKLQSHIDRDVLNLTDEQADAWEAKTELEWRLFWDSKECDITRTNNGRGITRIVYRQAKENGDAFIVLPRVRRKNVPYDLKLQTVEADRICNKNYAADTSRLSGGIERDEHGAPINYHIAKSHPGSYKVDRKTMEWDIVSAFGAQLNLRNVIHYFTQDRPGQSRGVPDLAPVIEPLKQLGRYTDAELAAAVISGLFTVFIETENGDSTLDLGDLGNETGASSSDEDYRLASGAIIGLKKGEKVHDTNPGRPNVGFDPFFMAIMRQIGPAIEMPVEILIKHFTASYSAARAALLEFWKYIASERQDLVENFLSLVYEVWMYEAVAKGRITAPGYLSDPIIRKAYLGAQWIGPAKGQINELAETNAAVKQVDMGISTLQEKTAEITGGDWDKKHRQSVKEHKARLSDGLIEDKSKKGPAQ